MIVSFRKMLAALDASAHARRDARALDRLSDRQLRDLNLRRADVRQLAAGLGRF